MSKRIHVYVLASAIVLASGALFAQSSTESQHPAASAQSAVVAQQSEPAKPAAEAKGNHAPAEEEEENIQFKYSSMVRGVAAKTGLSKEAVYWLFLIINFLILAAALVWIVRKALPHGFAPRTAEIQKGIEDARKASAEASARLAEIETRLSRLDGEIAGIRTAAEADFSVEEQRIKEAAEQDKKNIVASAEQEIAAAARTAQRELKAFVADLAVDLAEKKINVDDAADHALVREFAEQLGKDGK
ncbi:MAG TPA: ATP synthase F0 subunit B [Candidatus Saccharimonadales bacterium]|nr:ATP synthase F0 subunit B [Candidatus Saccharimonadales bacterium]